MRKVFVLSVVVLFLFICSVPARAQETVGDLKKELQKLQTKINILEQQQRVAGIPAEIKSDKGDILTIGGDFQINYYDVQEHADHPADNPYDGENPTNPHGMFVFDEVSLEIEVEPFDNIELEFEIDFEEMDEIDVDEAYIEFEEILPFNGEIIVGLRDRIISDNIEKYTDTDPLARTAFWKDPDIGIQYKGSHNEFYWHASVTNGLQLRSKSIGQDKSDRDVILQDDDYYKDRNDNKELGFGLGYNGEIGEWGNIDVLGFAYLGKLQSQHEEDDGSDTFGVGVLKSTGDEENINWGDRANEVIFPSYPMGSDEDRQNRYGVNVAYVKDRLDFYGQYIYADDGVMRRNAWFVQPSYKIDIDYLYLKSIRPVFRYGQYNINQLHTVNSPLTWDRQRYTFACVNEIKNNMELTFEWNINLEDTGGNNLRNNEFLTHFEYDF